MKRERNTIIVMSFIFILGLVNALALVMMDKAGHGDINRDGRVDGMDMSIVLTNWSK